MTLPPSLTEPARLVADALRERGATIAVAESSAGGLISAALLSVPGASAYYLGGTVIYTAAAARALVAPTLPLPGKIRGASQPWAEHLVAAITLALGSTWGVSETGATGPDGNPYGDPAGHAWVAVQGPDGVRVAEHVLTGSSDREGNMLAFASAALGLLMRTITATT